MSHLENIPYLEITDFTQDGKMKPYVGKGKPIIVLVQGIFCGYCTQMKPAFMASARENPRVTYATIQIDGEDSEKQLGRQVGSWWDKNYRGVPVVLAFDASGNYITTHQGARDKNALNRFAQQLK